jgi:hypothetical protein
MPFKPKTNKKIEVNESSLATLDSKHQEQIDFIEKNEKNIPKLKNELIKYKKILKSGKYNNSIEEKLNIIDKIKELKKLIKNIEKQRKEYYLKNSKYIFNYFENMKKTSNDNNKKKILNTFFKLKENKDTINNNQINKDITNDKIMNYSKQYLINLDDKFIDINDYIVNYENCGLCNGELISVDYDGMLVCRKCFHQQPYLIDNDKPSYKEPPKEVCFYAYKRINHFREILAQFQAKETTQISEEVIQNIKKQIKKERIGLDELTNEKTKQILKNLGYNKYYEHIPFIKEKLGIKPPTMPIELENTLCNLFLEIQKPYSKYCPNDRVNFLNYYYVLYKMCELLGEDKYLPYFYMLKDPIKRMEQDEIWKKICYELNWEFISTP